MHRSRHWLSAAQDHPAHRCPWSLSGDTSSVLPSTDCCGFFFFLGGGVGVLCPLQTWGLSASPSFPHKLMSKHTLQRTAGHSGRVRGLSDSRLMRQSWGVPKHPPNRPSHRVDFPTEGCGSSWPRQSGLQEKVAPPRGAMGLHLGHSGPQPAQKPGPVCPPRMAHPSSRAGLAVQTPRQKKETGIDKTRARNDSWLQVSL